MSYKFPSEAFINPHPIPFPSHMQASEFSTTALECGTFTDRLFALGHITQYFWLTNFFTGNWEGVLRASHVDRWIKRSAYVSTTASGTQWAEREIPIFFVLAWNLSVTYNFSRFEVFFISVLSGPRRVAQICIYHLPQTTTFSGYLEIIGTTSRNVGIFIWKPRIKRQLVI